MPKQQDASRKAADLLNWESLTNTIGQQEFTDPGANGVMRYYRIQQPAP